MPTPSKEVRSPKGEGRSADWAARPASPPRSIFGNYRSVDKDRASISAAVPPVLPLPKGEDRGEGEQTTLPLQTAIDVAIARSSFYRLLAQAYEDPTHEGWNALASADCRQCFESAAGTLAIAAPALAESARGFLGHLKPEAFESFLTAYLAAFGHAARGRCPLNEIEYGELKADPLFQPHRLADLAAFYKAFGLQVADDAGERQDHLCLELEFMCVLAAKEAYALEHQLDPEDLSMCRESQRKFLREHLSRWTPAFTRRLARLSKDTPLGALANLTGAFIEAECARFGITPGSEDLLLRPVDAAAESACASCGPTQTAPGIQVA
jgi:DMSO reductase family type II enzyme chaperone